jgi:predicted ATP-grasp superfamily ATP-dependent carboligase
MGRTLLGNPPSTVARVKDPMVFAGLCRSQRVACPETRLEPPGPDGGEAGFPADWLVKRAGGAGGAHVRPARADDGPAPGRYFQRRVEGRSLSALFLADAGRARILGFSATWPADRAGSQDGGGQDGGRQDEGRHGGAVPYLFGGAVGPVSVPADGFVRLRTWLDDLVAACGLRGLNGADLIEAEDGALWLVEINPRPCATIDLFDRRKGPSLLAAHVEACQGRLRAPRLEATTARALQVLYAGRPLRVPEGLDWPDWSADRPPPGSEIPRGAPICTIFATGAGPDEARAALAARAEAILGGLAPGGPDARCA